MKKIDPDNCDYLTIEKLMTDICSPDEKVRARAVRSLCPCHAGWQAFEENIRIVDQLKKDPSPTVRANALHVFEDAGEMMSEGYPTNPRETTNEMLHTKRVSRFRRDSDDISSRTKISHRDRRR